MACSRNTGEPERVILDAVTRGVFRIDSDGRIWRGERRADNRTSLGYLQVRLMVGGHRVHAGAHRVVYTYVKGPIPTGLVINHINGRKDDNRPENLEAVTYSQNMAHAHRLRLRDQRGDGNPAAKLTGDQVAEIRRLYASGGHRQADLAARFGVSIQAVSKVIRGERRAVDSGPISTDDHRFIASARDPASGRFVSPEDGRTWDEFPAEVRHA